MYVYLVCIDFWLDGRVQQSSHQIKHTHIQLKKLSSSKYSQDFLMQIPSLSKTVSCCSFLRREQDYHHLFFLSFHKFHLYKECQIYV